MKTHLVYLFDAGANKYPDLVDLNMFCLMVDQS